MVTTANQSVLVAEDEPAALENLGRLLEANGYYPVLAVDGQDAVDRAAQQEFGSALLDIKMPRLSGMEVLAQFQQDYPDMSVIMVTAVADVETAVEAMKLGAYDYILKPVNLDDVLLRLQKALERRFLTLQVKNHQREIEEKLLERERELRTTTTTLVESLIRETTIAEGEGVKGQGRSGSAPGAQAREFGLKVLRRLYGGE